MKQIYMQSKTPGYIKDVYQDNNQVNFNPKTNRMKSSIASKGDEGKREAIERMKNLNIFLIQNKGKGPPGRSRSPGAESYPEHPPDSDAHQDASPSLPKAKNTFWQRSLSFGYLSLSKMSKGWSLSLSKGNTEQTFYNTQIPNYYLQLNFTIMKKQILIFVFLALAIFTGVNKSYGQLNPSTNVVTPLSCTSSATFLNPVPGVPFGYQMNGSTGSDVVSGWKWFATKDPNFMTASGTFTVNKLGIAAGELLAADGNYNAAGFSAGNTVTITWTPEILANTQYLGTPSVSTFPSPTFVVGYGKGTNCADNIKVYEINPIKNFVVSIAPIDPGTLTTTAWGSTTSSCVASVASATYSAGNLVMDYGTNTVYFEIGAANFVTDFTPYISLISGLGTGQTAVITLHNTLADAQAGSTIRATQNWTAGSVGSTWPTATQFTAASSADVARGVSAFAKVVITNSSYESLAANPLTLAVDAREKTNAGIWDMEDADCLTLADASDQIDRATQNINPRPTIIGANIPDANTLAPNALVPKLP